jgi:hypothetical protein
MDEFRVAEHCDLVGLVIRTTAQERRRTQRVSRITAANDLQAHHVPVKRSQRRWISGIHADVAQTKSFLSSHNLLAKI